MRGHSSNSVYKSRTSLASIRMRSVIRKRVLS